MPDGIKRPVRAILEGPYWTVRDANGVGLCDCGISGVGAGVARARAEAIEAALNAAGDSAQVVGGSPVASCLVCGHENPLAVWISGTTHGVCAACRDAGQRATFNRDAQPAAPVAGVDVEALAHLGYDAAPDYFEHGDLDKPTRWEALLESDREAHKTRVRAVMVALGVEVAGDDR